MPATDHDPPLTVVVAAVAVAPRWSVITTEIASPSSLLPPLSPVPLTVTLPLLAMLMFGVVVNTTSLTFVAVGEAVVVLPAASVSVTV